MTYDKYIGLPYLENGRDSTGIDCWGLARLYYAQELGIELPSYAELYAGSRDPVVHGLINSYKNNWLETTSPVVGDLCLFNIYGEPQHVGIYIGNNKFLHSREGKDSVIDSLQSSQWKKRFVGFFKHTSQTVEVVGAPHPLKTGIIHEWTVAGTTVQNFVDFVHTKYKISKKLATKLVIVVDGIGIPQDKWSTTVLEAGQKIGYKVVPTGDNPLRMILMLAVVAAAPQLAGMIPGVGTGIGFTVAKLGVTLVGMALVDAIAPIRPPQQQPDPGSPESLNLFNGAGNQMNKFGAIPVVLGKIRYTGILGAVPYTETLTNSNIINLLIIWGFGPLEIDDICAGTVELNKAYFEDLPDSVPLPITLCGSEEEDSVEVKKFNERYPSDVEQTAPELKLLVNNSTDGNPWREVTFTQNSIDRIDIVFNFPEGMRELVVAGRDAGKVNETTAVIEIQTTSEKNQQGEWIWDNSAVFSSGNGDNSIISFSKVLTAPPAWYTEEASGDTTISVPHTSYRFYDICVKQGGGIEVFQGAVTHSLTADPSQEFINNYYAGTSYQELLGNERTWARLPIVPVGFIPIYRICLSTGGYVLSSEQSYLNNWSSTGLVLTYTDNTTTIYDSESIPTTKYAASTKIEITGGKIYNAQEPTITEAKIVPVFDTATNSIPNTTLTGPVSDNWSELLKTSGIWASGGGDIFESETVYFTVTESALYNIEGACDDYGSIFIDGRRALSLPKNGGRSTVSVSLYLQTGTHSLQLVGNNVRYEKGIACKITLVKGTTSNQYAGLNNIITVGTGGYFPKWKDAFNYVYSIKDLPPRQYAVRVRRVNNDREEILDAEDRPQFRKYHKVNLYSMVAYDTSKPPLRQLPRGKLARTVVNVQSSNKVNGQVEGINALVQTVCLDWDRASSEWTVRATNNPASLFRYILTHPANAYNISEADVPSKIDLIALQNWHEYCDTVTYVPGTSTVLKPRLTYNSVLTSTQSIMDTLRSICAAGKASPALVDGKWSVVVDKPREYVVQHFTPHNSWGFESTKILPILPHAFRVTFPDENNAYQTKEIHVYNYGYNSSNAEIYEELQLPGVTNEAQAIHLARWHLAQIKLRPEQYTFNTDFEYLVCSRGDLVRVTHDVPLWGVGSGRIKSIDNTGTAITLNNEVYLETGRTYSILIRTNSISSTNDGSVSKTITTVNQSGYYDEITLTSALPIEVETDNLVLVGELGSESHELIVLKVEPSTNNSAKLTLVDYSPEIYTANLEGELVYDADITTISNTIINSTINSAPNIVNIISERGTSQEISTGIYQTAATLSFTNPTGLSKNAELVQFEIALGSELFTSVASANTYIINKNLGTYTFTGLKTYEIYKVRARYTNSNNTSFGPWSSEYTFTAGAGGIEPSIVESITLDLENTYIVADLSTYGNEPNDFLCYEYRLYRDTGTEDFWDITPNVTNKIDVQRTQTQARFDLLKQANPRISAQGVTYRVACRRVNRNNEYSAESALGTIVIKTIQ